MSYQFYSSHSQTFPYNGTCLNQIKRVGSDKTDLEPLLSDDVFVKLKKTLNQNVMAGSYDLLYVKADLRGVIWRKSVNFVFTFMRTLNIAQLCLLFCNITVLSWRN